MSVRSSLGDNKGLRYEPVHQIEDFYAFDLAEAAHFLGGLDVESSREHRKTRPEELLGSGAELIAPVDEPSEGLLPWDRDPAATGQDVETTVKPFEKLEDGHGAQARGCELDRERNPIESPAQLGHCETIAVRDPEFGVHVPRSIHEQAHGFEGFKGSRRCGRIGGRRKGRHAVELLTENAQWFAARGEDPQPGHGIEKASHEGSDLTQKVFAVVKDQEELALLKVTRKPLER
ncbi:hypothetical protein GCM10027038_15290 [Arthrobacter bambusae]